MYNFCIDIYVHSSCFKLFLTGPKAVFKQQNPCSNNEINVTFEPGFWLKSVHIICQCEVMSLCSIETKWLTVKLFDFLCFYVVNFIFKRF